MKKTFFLGGGEWRGIGEGGGAGGVSDFFGKLTKYPNLKKKWDGGGVCWAGQMLQMALLPLKENVSAKLF